jgi:glycerol uptake facilitator-like aquaporin
VLDVVAQRPRVLSKFSRSFALTQYLSHPPVTPKVTRQNYFWQLDFQSKKLLQRTGGFVFPLVIMGQPKESRSRLGFPGAMKTTEIQPLGTMVLSYDHICSGQWSQATVTPARDIGPELIHASLLISHQNAAKHRTDFPGDRFCRMEHR